MLSNQWVSIDFSHRYLLIKQQLILKSSEYIFSYINWVQVGQCQQTHCTWNQRNHGLNVKASDIYHKADFETKQNTNPSTNSQYDTEHESGKTVREISNSDCHLFMLYQDARHPTQPSGRFITVTHLVSAIMQIKE